MTRAPYSSPPNAPPELRDALARLAWLMDRALTVPGTPIKVGLDALIGLLPVAGDLITGVVQVGIIMAAITRYKVPRAVAARMAANVLIDIAVGSIPLVGDLFDVGFKANTRNIALLDEVNKHRSLGQPVPTAPSVWWLVGIGSVFLLALFAVAVLAIVSAMLIVKAVTR